MTTSHEAPDAPVVPAPPSACPRHGLRVDPDSGECPMCGREPAEGQSSGLELPRLSPRAAGIVLGLSILTVLVAVCAGPLILTRAELELLPVYGGLHIIDVDVPRPCAEEASSCHRYAAYPVHGSPAKPKDPNLCMEELKTCVQQASPEIYAPRGSGRLLYVMGAFPPLDALVDRLTESVERAQAACSFAGKGLVYVRFFVDGDSGKLESTTFSRDDTSRIQCLREELGKISFFTPSSGSYTLVLLLGAPS